MKIYLIFLFTFIYILVMAIGHYLIVDGLNIISSGAIFGIILLLFTIIEVLRGVYD